MLKAQIVRFHHGFRHKTLWSQVTLGFIGVGVKGDSLIEKEILSLL